MREARIDKDTSRTIGLTEYRIMAETVEAVQKAIDEILQDPDKVTWFFEAPRPIGNGLYGACGHVMQGVFE